MATGFEPSRAKRPRRDAARPRLSVIQGGRRRKGSGNGAFVAWLAALSLATFTAVFLWSGRHAQAIPLSPRAEPERARFSECAGRQRVTCVVDGDTIWYRGTKIRIADINAPEVSDPHCAYEARLGAQATRRLTALLNAGPFTLAPVERAYDKYGRRLLVVTRGGRSLGDALVAEGLAERWRGFRRNWCAG